ncbi:hypothetical protein [Aneurinibacillus aneurinilyticus]|uniref:Uncharacterized protein n=1 Tax=Aneurinibacillus aneurinilyticus ATCC 12856 TaxID=649747 RepID=U1X4W9_ANEAE|nr:hypothetical protein [Aneurinibacillus aneurinilyticus]ERI10020.1 hypothetical protein HMPREF0083_01888 [Aneurinibacillus aneurinilyticus ATCC 12856]MED0707243.1 hypothetical protein [Aneurinibacillus aneurinilyticus]MED0726297.1 hypothetical protein [Aneurinibacillus aneurinilyticus]MED0730446.1 hypothetical protein [Aneurinibacillus aneurinilyticus]MED0744174.1 hypothetical protein [Aneurinibacillus aneurinilyticus]
MKERLTRIISIMALTLTLHDVPVVPTNIQSITMEQPNVTKSTTALPSRGNRTAFKDGGLPFQH